MMLLKKFINSALKMTGYQIQKNNSDPKYVGTMYRPVGDMEKMLQDLKKRGLVCKHIIDVGANKTEWSSMAKTVFTDADFCLIEPQDEMRPYLDRFVNNNPGSKYFLNGAGPENQKKTFTVWDDLAGSSFLPEIEDELQEAGKQRSVDVIMIDTLTEEKVPVPELMKLDVQGYELEALKGAESTFGKTEVYILEVSLYPFLHDMPVITEVINFMDQRDYVIYDFPGFSRRPLDGALGQCDICFVKKNGFLRARNEWI